MRTNAKLTVVFLAAASGVMLVACGGGGGGGGGGGCGAAGASCASVAGKWSIASTSGPNSCGDSGTTTLTADVSQTGCSITVTAQGIDGTFSGTIDGNHLCWAGSYPDQGGTMTISGVSITVAGDALSATGTMDYAWRLGGEACEGKNSVTLTRL